MRGLFEAVRIPINLYHIPGTSEAPITLELLKNLSQYPHLAGIKDSSGSKDGYKAFAEAFPALNMRTGTNSNLEQAFDHGMGAILADGNVFTKLCSDVFAAYRAKADYKPALEKLRAAQRGVQGLGGAPPAMKYGLSLQMGGPPIYTRAPMVEVSNEQKGGDQARPGQAEGHGLSADREGMMQNFRAPWRAARRSSRWRWPLQRARRMWSGRPTRPT
jgi:dihydrodipicolinate synthase/N-acetylneuraminate lyase